MRHAAAVTLSGLMLLSLWGCATTGASTSSAGLVVVPDDVATATVPKDMQGKHNAVVLYDIGYVHYDPMDIGSTYYPSYVYSRFTKVKLLTRAATEGGHWGTIMLRHLDELKKMDAWVEKKDGSKVVLKETDFVKTILIKDAIPGYTPPLNYYETTVIFPGLDPGDTIGYHYTSRGRELTWNFNHMDAPTLYSKFMVARPPRRAEIQPVIFNRHDLKIEKSETKGMIAGMSGFTGIKRQATYDIWTARNVPPVTFEPGMPPMVDVASRVRVWQGFRRWDWNTMGTSYSKWFFHYGRRPSLAKELAEKATAGLEGSREKAKAIHDWVKANLNIQDVDTLTWVPRQFEITTLNIKKILEEKNASPEKAANLMWLMMKESGIDATVVLAIDNMNPPVEEGLPYLYQFTHPLLVLSDGTWIDTTNRMCPFGQIPWTFEGKKGLWLKGKTVAFKDIPESSQADNKRKIDVKAEIDIDGNVTAKLEMSLHGQMALAFRMLMGPMTPKERDDLMRKLITGAVAKAEIEEYTLQNMDKPSEPLKMNVSYKVLNHAQVLRDKMVFKLGAFLHDLLGPALRNRRGWPVYIVPKPTTEIRSNQVRFPFKRLEENDVFIKFPPGFRMQAAPKGFRTRELASGTAMGVQNSYGSADGLSMQIIRRQSINETLVTDKGYEQLRKMIVRLIEQKETLITLEIPK
ncbi:MAG: hypothetical protein JRF33_06140 [Deltaproteobacteria bacterium]|nr:hypothetical protein [Deltaproteobacteria bacterium]